MRIFDEETKFIALRKRLSNTVRDDAKLIMPTTALNVKFENRRYDIENYCGYNL